MNCWSLNLPGVSLYTLVTVSVTIVFFRAKVQGPHSLPFLHPFLTFPSCPPGPSLIPTALSPPLLGFNKALHHEKYKETGIFASGKITPPLSQFLH